jgi:hypothetical protein
MAVWGPWDEEEQGGTQREVDRAQADAEFSLLLLRVRAAMDRVLQADMPRREP